MSRESQLVDEAVNIFDVARRYNLEWASRDYGKAIQVRCPMHADTTPSARVYTTNSGYCFTCQKSFGPVGLVVALEGVGYGQATDMLARWYHVDLSPDPDEEEARRLIGLARGNAPAVSDDERAEMRRLAALTRRCVGQPWEAAERLLAGYEQLDLTDIEPEQWLGASTIEGLALQ